MLRFARYHLFWRALSPLQTVYAHSPFAGEAQENFPFFQRRTLHRKARREILMANIGMTTTIIYNGKIIFLSSEHNKSRHKTEIYIKRLCWKIMVHLAWVGELRGDGVALTRTLATALPNISRAYLWAQFHLLIVFIHARKGLIILGNLYLLIGSERANFYCDCANKKENFASLFSTLYFRSMKLDSRLAGFSRSCTAAQTDRLLWWLDGGSVIIPCIMCDVNVLKFHLHNGWRVL